MKNAMHLLRRYLLLALSALVSMGAAPAALALTQTQSTLTCAQVLGPGTVAWNTPGYAATSDNQYATSAAVLNNTTTELLQCLNYGFAIPEGATINGITVNIERKSTVTGVSRDSVVQLLKGGAAVGANRATATTYTTADVTEAHGGAADLWATTWTPADINAANFGVQYSATRPATGSGGTITVDRIQITVTYTLGTAASQTTSQASCASVNGPGSVAWTNPAFAASSDDLDATASVDGSTSELLQCTNFGFNIPTGSTIDGFTVEVERSASANNNGGVVDSVVQLIKGGTAGGTNLASGTMWPLADTVATYGGAAQLWGQTWTAADVNAANFGISLSATKASGTGNAITAQVDQMRITVHYRAPILVGNGTNPGNVTIGPSPDGGITDLDAFTVATVFGTDSITGLTVTLGGTTPLLGVGEVRITNDAGTVTYFTAVTNPGSTTVVFSGGTPIPVTTTATQYKVRITPKAHADMPAPAGGTYTVTGTVTAVTSAATNPAVLGDSGSATITIDNLSPNAATALSSTAGAQQVTLGWTTSNSADFTIPNSRSVVLRWTGAAGAQVPAEGADYSVGDTIGTATVVCVRSDAASTAVSGIDGAGTGGCSATPLANATLYNYRVFQRDANGNYNTGTAFTAATTLQAVTLGDGTNPADATLAPGGAITDLDAFTFVVPAGTASVTGLTVTLTGANSFQGLSEVRITNNAGTTTYFAAVANPASNTVVFSGGTPIPVNTTVTTFKVRITPKTHANMPAPPGASYAVGGTVTAFTTTNAKTGTDTDSATVTVDNLSPDGATAVSTVSDDTKVTLNWTTSSSTDASQSVVLRWTGAAGAQVPVEGTTYTVGNTIGAATVVCVRTDAASTAVSGTDGAGAGGCSATPLVNGTSYAYRVFQKDANGNYDVGVSLGSVTPTVRPTLVSASLSCGTLTTLEVVFSRPLTAATAQNIANYALNNGGTVSAAVLGVDTRVVTLTVGNIVAGASYVLTVSNVTDSGGTPILPGSTISFFSESGYTNGIKGTYYSQNGNLGAAFAFTGTAVDRIDAQINFNWAAGAPGPAGIGANGFSVRWQGFVTVPVTGTYTFRTRSDDGVRLYVGGATLVDNWTDHSAVNNDSSGVALTAGQYYPLTMEFYENGGDAVAELWWSGPSTGGFQFIPAANLWRCGGSTAPTAIYKMDEFTWNGTAGEVQDSGPSGLHGTSSSLSPTKPTTSGASPALTGTPGTCAYGVFNRANKDYIELPGFPNLGATSFTVTAWVRTTDRTQAGQRILIDDQNNAGGWGLSLGDGGAGMVRLFSRGSATQTLDTGAVIANNTWYFVAASISIGANTTPTLYVFDTSGALVNTVNATWTAFTWGTDAGPASIGGETNTGTENTSAFGFSGNIDEVRVYGQALTQADILAILGQRRPCISLLSHYAVTFPNGTSGVTCEPTDVVISAHDASHALIAPGSGTVMPLGTSTSTGAWLTPPVVGTPANWSVSGSNNGVAQYIWPGGETAIRVQLRHNTVVPSLTVVPGGVGAVENSAISFADTAFRVTANGTSTATVGTHIAGKDTNVGFGAQTLYLQAIRTDTNTGTCVGLIQNQTVNVEMAASRDNPTGGSSKVSVRENGGGMKELNTGAGVLGGYADVSLAFDSQSKAPLVINYPNAGTVSLSARYQLPGPPTSVYLSGSTGAFVVRPFGFRLSDPTTAATPSPSSPVFVKAGANFNVTLTAVQWKSGDDADVDGIPDSNAQIASNNPTTNFGQETGPASATLTHTLNAPSGGAAGSLGGVTNFTAFSGGAKQQAVSWSEVGFIDLKASSTNYLGSGQDISSSSAGLTGVGRFYPDRFDLTGTPTVTNRSASSCTPASTFTYMGERLSLDFTLQAKNTSGGITTNYAGAYAKLNPAVIGQLGFGARSGATVLTSRLDLGLGSTGSFTSGAAAVTALLSVQRAAAPDGPYASLQFGVVPADSDGVTIASPDLDADGTAGNERKNLGVTTDVRFGRLRVQGVAGSSVINARVPLQLQYFNGTGFARNSDDSCTTLAAENFALSDYQRNLETCETAALGNVTFASGDGTLVLAKPGAPNTGSVRLTANLGTTPSGNYCAAVGGANPATVGAARSYLQGNWTGATWDVNPYGRVAFGVFGGLPNSIIFMRENY